VTTGLRFYPAAHRYKLDGEWVPSVTGIAKLAGGCEGLIKWAARSSAEYAYDNPLQLEQLDREPYVDLVSTEARRARDKASAAGVEVHRLAQDLLADLPVEVPEHLAGHVEQTVALIERHDVMALHSEALVGSRSHQYAGRLDVIARLITSERGEHRALIDWKTGRTVWTDVALQLAGYAGADFIVTGTTEEPMPRVDAYYVAHISSTSGELYPVTVDDAVWRYFTRARELFPFSKLRPDDLIGDALDHPEPLHDGTNEVGW
jgi:hypothetical protein